MLNNSKSFKQRIKIWLKGIGLKFFLNIISTVLMGLLIRYIIKEYLSTDVILDIFKKESLLYYWFMGVWSKFSYDVLIEHLIDLFKPNYMMPGGWGGYGGWGGNNPQPPYGNNNPQPTYGGNNPQPTYGDANSQPSYEGNTQPTYDGTNTQPTDGGFVPTNNLGNNINQPTNNNIPTNNNASANNNVSANNNNAPANHPFSRNRIRTRFTRISDFAGTGLQTDNLQLDSTTRYPGWNRPDSVPQNARPFEFCNRYGRGEPMDISMPSKPDMKHIHDVLQETFDKKESTGTLSHTTGRLSLSEALNSIQAVRGGSIYLEDETTFIITKQLRKIFYNEPSFRHFINNQDRAKWSAIQICPTSRLMKYLRDELDD